MLKAVDKADDVADAWKIVDKAGDAAKVVKNGAKAMSKADFDRIYKMSIHNKGAKSMTLGKYLDGTLESGSYIAKAQKSGDTYFSLGTKWDEIKNAYGLTDDDMFELFNTKALDDAVSQGKSIRFSQDPRKWNGTALGDEWKYLQNKHGYSKLVQKGEYWYAK